MAIAAGAIAVIVGTCVGMTAGYRGGWTDALLMRTVDVLLALPPILITLVTAALLPRNTVVLVSLVGILLAPGAARVIRGLTQQIASSEYIAYAEAAGESQLSVMLTEVLPNVRSRLALEFALRTGFAVLTLSSLNFLGVGISAPAADWALNVAEGRPALTFAPWISLAPAAGIVLLVTSVNVIANAIGESWE
jgi:peptide/nickel transport system permease protein